VLQFLGTVKRGNAPTHGIVVGGTLCVANYIYGDRNGTTDIVSESQGREFCGFINAGVYGKSLGNC